MNKLIYDAYFDGGGSGGPYVVKTENKEASVIIECECGCHMLQVTMNADVYTNSDETVQVHQTFYLAMFQYGNENRGFWGKLKIALKYMRTGKMFSNQLVFTPAEADKLSEFLTANKIEIVKP